MSAISPKTPAAGQAAGAAGADPIAAALARLYADAGWQPGAAQSAITPLFTLTREQALLVDEVPGLTRQAAARHLAATYGQSLLAPGGDESLAGFLYANAWGGWVLANADDPLPRRRFTIAHELGHYVLHFLPLLAAAQETGDDDLAEFDEEIPATAEATGDLPLAQGRIGLHRPFLDVPTPALDLVTQEEQANRFAGALLMPEVACRRLVAQYAVRCGRSKDVLVRRLAGELLVSREAMRRRLEELRLA